MGNIDDLVQEKTCVLLVILCTEMSSRPTVNFAEDKSSPDAQLFYTALIKVANICLNHKPASRLVVSQLLPALEKQLVHDGETIIRDDLWVSAEDRRPHSTTNSGIEMLRAPPEDGC